MTVCTLAEVAYALGAEVKLTSTPTIANTKKKREPDCKESNRMSAISLEIAGETGRVSAQALETGAPKQ